MTTATATEPLIVHCERCAYEWQIGWLPMPMDSVAVLLKSARCPRGHHRKFLRMGPTAKPTGEGDPVAWLTNGDTGISSETIWSVLMNRRIAKPHWHADVPHDPADFGRCYRLLKVMPSWRARLPEVAEKYPKWAPLVAAWDELTALYEEEEPSGMAPKLYARMKELRGDK